MSAHRIKILDKQVSRKIAAGEVIERPNSVLRELLDNAIDAQAQEIVCSWKQGGIDYIEVRDNGIGMDIPNLELCCLSHATSKIYKEDDLEVTQTLGFRGEALYSIAGVSKLTIESCLHNSNVGASLQIEGGGQAFIQEKGLSTGTTVRVQELFYNLPARKKFLKSIRSEAGLCRATFIEKACAHPNVSFKLFVDGKASIILPARTTSTVSNNYRERIVDIYKEQFPKELMHTIQGIDRTYSADIVLALPPLNRADRKYIQIYCNGRRILDFSLVQACHFACSSILPGGHFPIVFVFLHIDPREIDFNIHPAKKEVRFKEPEALHQYIRKTIQSFIDFYIRRNPSSVKQLAKFDPIQKSPTRTQAYTFPEPHYEVRNIAPPSSRQANELFADGARTAVPQQTEYIYRGQIFQLFFLVEVQNSLYIIDMHAAHERILYNKFKEEKTSEPLLLPMRIQSELSLNRLKEMCSALNNAGFVCTYTEDAELSIQRVPSALAGKEAALKNILSDLSSQSEDLERELYASMACRTAIKDGDLIDTSTAHSIIAASFALPVKRCPHGRPIWFEITKHELFQLLGRTS